MNAHYQLRPYGRWAHVFTSPLGRHKLSFAREVAEAKMAETLESHRARSLGSTHEAEVLRAYFEDSATAIHTNSQSQ